MTYRDNRGRNCHVCNHERRAEIELRLANNTPVRVVALKYGVGKDSCYRHRSRHMDASLVQQLQATGQRVNPSDLAELKRTESEGLLQTLVHERARQQRIADKAEVVDDYANATRASVAALKSSELIAKLLGDIKTGSVTQNILIAPEFHAFRTAVIQALRAYPEAKLAVLQQMQAIEQREVIDGELVSSSA
jgi:RNase P/RNase MRP subunit POP5